MLENRLTLGSFNRWLGIGIWGLILLTLLTPFGAFLLSMFATQTGNGWSVSEQIEGSERIPKSYQLDHILPQEKFSPAFQMPWIPQPPIRSQLIRLEFANRPDCPKEEAKILLGLEGVREQRYVTEGEIIYFRDEEGKNVHFSEQETPFSAQVMPEVDGQLEIIFETKYVTHDGKELYRHQSACQLAEPQRKTFVEEENEELKSLQASLIDAQLFLPDQLFANYGGEAFSNKRGLYRLAIPEDGQISHFFVQQGDCLVWRGGKWQLAEGETRGFSLALIRTLGPRGGEITIWGRDGVSSLTMTFALNRGEGFAAAPNTLFHKLYKRSENSVVCDLSGRSKVLRRGDWLVKRGKRWQTLKNTSDLKEFLRYAFKGELVIFDGVEKRDEVSYLKGHYFNEERTQVMKIDLPLGERGTKKIITTNRRPPFDPHLFSMESEGVDEDFEE